MGRPLKIAKYNTAQSVQVDIFYPTSTPNVGIVGGNTSVSNTEYIAANVIANVPGAGAGEAYIIRQKGKRKFLVTLTTDTTQAYANICVLVNTDDVATLTENQMAIVATDSAAANVPMQYVQNNYGVDFSNVGHYLTFDTANSSVQPDGSGTSGRFDIVQIPSA
jgi:hypothetical protein